MQRDQLFQQVYDQLRKHAQLALHHERPDHTLSATALVHEAYIRLGTTFANQAHFYSSAALAMQRILTDHARQHLAQKRGNPHQKIPFTSLPDLPDFSLATDPTEILALDAALSRLEVQDAQAASVVRLRYFTGLDIEHTAACLGISPRTAKRDWQFARAFLFRELSE